MAGVLNRPIRVWHAILGIAVIGAVVVAGSAIAGGSGAAIDRMAVDAGKATSFKGTGYHYVGKVANNPAGAQTTIVQECPRGTIPIAGGGGGVSEIQGEQSLVYSNLADGPDANTKLDSWLVAVDNHSEADLQASVEAVCVDR
jgi:hypothetical protein